MLCLTTRAVFLLEVPEISIESVDPFWKPSSLSRRTGQVPESPFARHPLVSVLALCLEGLGIGNPELIIGTRGTSATTPFVLTPFVSCFMHFD